MAAATGPRKSVSIYDYPEHLNPFHDDDHHNKIRFWTLGKSRLQRSNSITFQGIKDLKNSWYVHKCYSCPCFSVKDFNFTIIHVLRC